MILVPALGLALIAQAFAVRAGRSRTFYSIYRTDAPPWVRNRVFSLLPGGLALIAGTGTVGFARSETGAAAVVLMLLTWGALIVLLVWLFHPPEFMKPSWLREVESGRAPEPPGLSAAFGAAGPGGVRRIYLPPPVYWSLWAATGVFFALWLVFDWSWSWIVGLGAGVSTLAASTPRKGRGLR
jgi:hypothetical protein